MSSASLSFGSGPGPWAVSRVLGNLPWTDPLAASGCRLIKTKPTRRPSCSPVKPSHTSHMQSSDPRIQGPQGRRGPIGRGCACLVWLLSVDGTAAEDRGDAAGRGRVPVQVPQGQPMRPGTLKILIPRVVVNGSCLLCLACLGRTGRWAQVRAVPGRSGASGASLESIRGSRRLCPCALLALLRARVCLLFRCFGRFVCMGDWVSLAHLHCAHEHRNGRTWENMAWARVALKVNIGLFDCIGCEAAWLLWLW